MMEVPDSAGGNRVMFMHDHPLAAYLAKITVLSRAYSELPEAGS
jgi:hypothetical protein